MSHFRESASERFDREYPHFAAMRAGFRDVAAAILSGSVQFPNVNGDRCAGAEIERSAITANGTPISQTARDKLAARLNLQKELGSAQMESGTPPVCITAAGGLTTLKEVILAEERRVENGLAAMNAREVRLGIQPLLNLCDFRIVTRSVERYRLVPRFHDEHRGGHVPETAGGIPVRTTRVVAPFSSIQPNLDVNMNEAIRLLNRAFATAAYAVALGGNARYMNGMDTGWSDIRNHLWMMSHDIRTSEELRSGFPPRVGLPARYYTSLPDYFQDVYDQPPILNDPDNAFPIMNGLFWRVARLKFPRLTEDSRRLVLEFRPVSLQPTAFEDYAMLAFAIGHILAAQAGYADELPFGLMEYNWQSAQENGMLCPIFVMKDGAPTRMEGNYALRHETLAAMDGLRSIGASNDELRELQACWMDRIANGPPSVRFHRKVERIRGERPLTRDVLKDVILGGT